MIFLDNHDVSRFYSVVNKDLEKFKIGIGLLMTLRGIPQLYYGTEILLDGTADPDGKVRQDFPGGWPNDPINKFVDSNRTELENEAFNYIKALANYRKNSVVLKEGLTMQYTPKDGVYTFFRYRKEGTVMIMINPTEKMVVVDANRFEERTDGFTLGKNIVTGKGEKIKGYVNMPAKTIKIIELLK